MTGTAPDAVAAANADEARLRDERAGIENSVELILEGRLTRVIRDAGLTRHIGGDVVWPPVNFEFQDAPAVLVRSPRSEIRREDETLLQGDLPGERIDSIETAAEANRGEHVGRLPRRQSGCRDLRRTRHRDRGR